MTKYLDRLVDDNYLGTTVKIVDIDLSLLLGLLNEDLLTHPSLPFPILVLG